MFTHPGVWWAMCHKHLKDITSRLSNESCSQKKSIITLFLRFCPSTERKRNSFVFYVWECAYLFVYQEKCTYLRLCFICAAAIYFWAAFLCKFKIVFEKTQWLALNWLLTLRDQLIACNSVRLKFGWFQWWPKETLQMFTLFPKKSAVSAIDLFQLLQLSTFESHCEVHTTTYIIYRSKKGSELILLHSDDNIVAAR